MVLLPILSTLGCIDLAPDEELLRSRDLGVQQADMQTGQLDAVTPPDAQSRRGDASVRRQDSFIGTRQDQGARRDATRPLDTSVIPDAAVVRCNDEADEGDPCNTGRLGECGRGRMACIGSEWVCQPANNPGAEICSGTDIDCDGAIDEGPVCGQWAQTNCRVWWGWRRRLRGQLMPEDNWQACMDLGEVQTGDQRCTSTRGDGRFVHLTIKGDVGKNMGGDQFAIAFTCEDDVEGRGRWIQNNCQVYLGRSNNDDDGMGVEPVDSWGPCPDGLAGADPQNPDVACVASEGDGAFHPLTLSGDGPAQHRDMDQDDALAIAFQCNDARQQRRSSGMTAALDVFIGFSESLDRAYDNGYVEGEGLRWDGCPEVARDNNSSTRCVSSGGTGQFFRMDILGDVKDDDIFGLALRARP